MLRDLVAMAKPYMGRDQQQSPTPRGDGETMQDAFPVESKDVMQFILSKQHKDIIKE